MTTEQHGSLIAESWINGQRKQAVEQFAEAQFEGCAAKELLSEIKDFFSISYDWEETCNQVIVFASAVIEV